MIYIYERGHSGHRGRDSLCPDLCHAVPCVCPEGCHAQPPVKGHQAVGTCPLAFVLLVRHAAVVYEVLSLSQQYAPVFDA